MGAKYRHSYIYQSKQAEEEDIPTAICMHQDSLFAGYVNNNFLVEFNLDSQKPLNSIQFQADGQISTNRYLCWDSGLPPMGVLLLELLKILWSEYSTGRRWFIVLRLTRSLWCQSVSLKILMSCSVADRMGLLSCGIWGSTAKYVLSRYSIVNVGP